MSENWKLQDTVQDSQSITSDWQLTDNKLIDGVEFREVKNVIKVNGMLTEIYRKDWQLDDLSVDQVFQVVLNPGGVSAWHAHAETTDRLFVNFGAIRVVLYDSRPESPTNGLLNDFRLSLHRPGILIVPPKVWHGIKNQTSEPALILNLVDKAYNYQNPDHYRVAENHPGIPFSFNSGPDLANTPGDL